MYDIIAIGELLMDMTPVKHQEGISFLPNPGGAPCNFLAMAQKMGAKTAFIGKVGEDQFGHQLKNTIEAVGIDTKGLLMDTKTPTTLAFVHLNEEGDRSFSFYRKGCADVSLRMDEVDMDMVKQAKVFYFGSLALTDEPIKTTAMTLVKEAHRLGKVICYDPNYRPLLWKSEASAVEGMKWGLSYANVLKVSDEEAILLTGENDLEKAAIELAKLGISLVCITRGEQGTLAYFKETLINIPAMTVKVVDTTGAGDAFFGTLMQQVGCSDKNLEELRVEEVKLMIQVANRAAGLCVENYGAIPALPTRDRVLSL